MESRLMYDKGHQDVMMHGLKQMAKPRHIPCKCCLDKQMFEGVAKKDGDKYILISHETGIKHLREVLDSLFLDDVVVAINLNSQDELLEPSEIVPTINVKYHESDLCCFQTPIIENDKQVSNLFHLYYGLKYSTNLHVIEKVGEKIWNQWIDDQVLATKGYVNPPKLTHEYYYHKVNHSISDPN